MMRNANMSSTDLTRPHLGQTIWDHAYGAVISNNAGGYSFAKSGANGRILRYIFNDFDRPGRYIYIRDNESKDYWSASWQPVGKDLAEYKSECRHGTGYTKMLADYSGIHSQALYYVPLNQEYEVWFLEVTNCPTAQGISILRVMRNLQTTAIMSRIR